MLKYKWFSLHTFCALLIKNIDNTCLKTHADRAYVTRNDKKNIIYSQNVLYEYAKMLNVKFPDQNQLNSHWPAVWTSPLVWSSGEHIFFFR